MAMMGRAVSPSSEERTLVLVGRTGNEKSATGNSILRRRGWGAFKSMSRPGGVTSTCQLRSTELEDGQFLNVIDTPGLFDISADVEFVGKEIVKCISMAGNGIRAFLLVLSVRSRFSSEEEAVVQSLWKFFGSKITDYMIVVFSGGDDLEENNETLDDYLGHDCPEPLKEILKLCGNRCVLFDNKTKEEAKKSEQLEQLLSLVNTVVDRNGGKPFTDELFVFELKIKRLEEQLAEEQTARLEVEAKAEASQKKSNDEIRKLGEKIDKAPKEPKKEEKKKKKVADVPFCDNTYY